MRLIIAEKPSQARSLAKVLGIDSKQSYGKIVGKDTVITWCIGHLVTLAMPEDYDQKLKFWKTETLPIIPRNTKLLPVNNTIEQWNVIHSLLTSDKFECVINAADSGREGELIFDNVYQLSKSKLPVLRLWTASLTDQALKKAFQNLRPSQDFAGLRDAARCRAEADWLIGLNATRLETLSAQAQGKNDGVYPVGRVQTPTLALLVDRELEIQNFKSEPYWTINCEFKQDEHTYKGSWFKDKETRIKTQEEAKQIKSETENQIGKIVTLDVFQEKKPSPLLYDLTTLQREANIKLAYTAEQTLKICQSLYETYKVISYPRTNSRYLTPADVSSVDESINHLQSIAAYKQMILEKPFHSIPKKFVNEKMVEDHHAIIPTGITPPSNMGIEEKKIFDMVFRRTLAAYYPDRIDLVSKIETEVATHLFRTRGRIIKESGWWAVNPNSHDQQDVILPNVDKNKSVEVNNCEIKKNTTLPPLRYTEASLLKKMETAGKDIDDAELREAMKQSGLGTPATRASIIEGLKNRHLISMQKKSMVPTEKGISLIKQIPDGPLKSAEMTGEWEKKLSQMAKGEYDRNQFMKEIIDLTTNLTKLRKHQINDLEIQHQSHGECPKCKNPLLLKVYRAFSYVKCSNHQCRLTYNCDTSGKPLGGYCQNLSCAGPVTKTKNGFLLCTRCNTWQNNITSEKQSVDDTLPITDSHSQTSL